jgi:hypothetical protein
MGIDTGASNLREPRDVANFADNVLLHLNKTSPPDEYATSRENTALHHERITLPTTFNVK